MKANDRNRENIIRIDFTPRPIRTQKIEDKLSEFEPFEDRLKKFAEESKKMLNKSSNQ